MDRPKLPDGPMFCKGPFQVWKGSTWIVGVDAWGETCYVADIRGWGYLTGHGRGLGLSGDEAFAAQQSAMQFIVDAMNEKLARDATAEAPDVAEMIRDAEANDRALMMDALAALVSARDTIRRKWATTNPERERVIAALSDALGVEVAPAVIRAEAATLRGEKEPK